MLVKVRKYLLMPGGPPGLGPRDGNYRRRFAVEELCEVLLSDSHSCWVVATNRHPLRIRGNITHQQECDHAQSFHSNASMR